MTPGRLVGGAMLLLFWIALWRRVTLGIVVSGLAVVALALWLVPGPRPGPAVRAAAAFRLGSHVLGQLVVATAQVAWEVLTPTDRSRPGVVAVELPAAVDRELTLVALLITFTPGSFVVDVDPRNRVVLVHLLHRSSEATVRAEVVALHRRVQALWRRSSPDPSSLLPAGRGRPEGEQP